MKSLLSALLLLFVNNSLLAESNWAVDYANSSISFVATYDDIAFDGKFEAFEVQIYFDQNNFIEGKFISNIQTDSANTNSRDRDDALKSRDWFYTKKYPKANFVSTAIHQQDAENFSLKGLLTIRDVEREITFPIRWKQQEAFSATAYAELELDRRDYNIGVGDWAKDDTIGFIVKVKIDLRLKSEK